MTTTKESAQKAATTAQKAATTGDRNFIVVDVGKRKTRKAINRLRKGRGALMGQVDELIGDLLEQKVIDESNQPIVLVVREKRSGSWDVLA